LISIIICSRTNNINEDLKTNIDKTIGVPFEIIIIDNSANYYNIFSAYSEGVKKSIFPFLCFMHDDILYHTNNWGVLVDNHFSDDKTGAIGIAGTGYVATMPGAWWDGGMVNINIIPWNAINEQPDTLAHSSRKENRIKVAVLDGVWFCIRKSLFNSIKFDEMNYKGYHFYDVDISLQVHQTGYNVYSVFDILIQHYSKGDLNSNWLENALIFKNKWQKILPVAVDNTNYIQRCEAEINTLQKFVHISLKNKIPPKIVYKLAFNQLRKFYTGLFYYKTAIHLSKYLIRSITG
jgi:GT2 family glycosyltransferase